MLYNKHKYKDLWQVICRQTDRQTDRQLKHKKSSVSRRSNGFTLAEVLITLMIIGVVSALTIPTLITTITKLQYVSSLKKDYAVIAEAYNLIKSDYDGNILSNPYFGSATNTGAEDIGALNALATKINFLKNCGSGTGCWYNTPLKWLGETGVATATPDTDWSGSNAKAILLDGTTVMINIWGTSCTSGPVGTPLEGTVCGALYLDVNGAAGPNVTGRDFFNFWISTKGIYPHGLPGDGFTCVPGSSASATSDGCAWKVITEGAMNY